MMCGHSQAADFCPLCIRDKRIAELEMGSRGEAASVEALQVAEALRTQDNRATDTPIFFVQQRRRVFGISSDYTDEFTWISDDDDKECDKELCAKLESAGAETQGYRRVGYIDSWEFVTCCFTEQGCRDYISLNDSRLDHPRVYVESGYRNPEFRLIRQFLMGLKKL